jgi:hypothetical protein
MWQDASAMSVGLEGLSCALTWGQTYTSRVTIRPSVQRPAYNCIREKIQHLRLHSYADVANFFKECSDYKELGTLS